MPFVYSLFAQVNPKVEGGCQQEKFAHKEKKIKKCVGNCGEMCIFAPKNKNCDEIHR